MDKSSSNLQDAGVATGSSDEIHQVGQNTEIDLEVCNTPDGEEPNDYEKRTLRRVGERLPTLSFLIAVVELTERFSYYGTQGLFQNYISHKRGYDPHGAPGLGLGSQAATGLNMFYQFLCYCSPIFGAIIADQYLGKYKAIIVFSGVYWTGLLILWTTSLPAAMDKAGLPGFIVAIIIIGIGTGGIKANIAPLIADQYQRRRMAIKTEKSTGERVVIDPAITYQRIYMMFYWCINVGSTLSLAITPFLEKYKGFWSAYLMCFCIFNFSIGLLLTQGKSYVIRPPQGSVVTDAFKAIGIMVKHRSLDSAKPSWRKARGYTKPVPWNDHFVEELKRALRACKVFMCYPVFWVCYGQFSSNFVTQAKQMQGHGMPNDFMQIFDPLSVLVFTPLIDRCLYPVLRKAGVELRPIARISIGYFFSSLCVTYAAIMQHVIYKSGPCYATVGSDACTGPNHVHIALQIPAYVFIGIAEIFISVSGLEYAYTKAPPSMKSFVQSLYLFTNSFGAAISMGLVPVAKNPKFVWMYTGVAITAFITSIAFYALFRHYDAQEENMYDLDRDEPTYDNHGVVTGEKDVESERRGS